MRVLFWGTPPFAVPTLRALTEEGHDVVGVVTRPDRPAGRGRVLRPSAVKEAAVEDGLIVLTPDAPRGDEFLGRIRALRPEVSVVVAFGHILRPEVLDVPTVASVNLHASLLPELRGAAPIHWALLRGHEQTGVSVMRMVEGMDAGPVYLQEVEPIGPFETSTELALRLSEVGAVAMVELLALLSVGQDEAQEQDHEKATYAPKVDRTLARVDWAKDSIDVVNHIRAMDELPGAWTQLDDQPLKVYRPRPAEGQGAGHAPGTVVSANEVDGLCVSVADGLVSLGEVQPSGKRRMAVEPWIRGRGVREGQRFV